MHLEPSLQADSLWLSRNSAATSIGKVDKVIDLARSRRLIGLCTAIRVEKAGLAYPGDSGCLDSSSAILEALLTCHLDQSSLVLAKIMPIVASPRR